VVQCNSCQQSKSRHIRSYTTSIPKDSSICGRAIAQAVSGGCSGSRPKETGGSFGRQSDTKKDFFLSISFRCSFIFTDVSCEEWTTGTLRPICTETWSQPIAKEVSFLMWNERKGTGFEISKAMRLEMVIWVAALCSIRTQFLHSSLEDGGTMFPDKMAHRQKCFVAQEPEEPRGKMCT